MALVVLMCLPAWASAQMYRWLDDQGKVHYSEGLDSIPEGFRSQATTFEASRSESAPDKPDTHPQTGAPSAPNSATAPTPADRRVLWARNDGTQWRLAEVYESEAQCLTKRDLRTQVLVGRGLKQIAPGTVQRESLVITHECFPLGVEPTL